MSAELVKRSQYFNPPTTECPHSSRNHFEDWEEFHLPMARMHHVALHGRGVASGLAVSVQEAGTQIEVGPGVAIDGKGELIALSAAGTGGHRDATRPGEAGQQIDPPFRLGIAGRETGTYYLCIQFAQALRFAEGSAASWSRPPGCACSRPRAISVRSRPARRSSSRSWRWTRRALRRCGIAPRGSRTAASCSGKGTGELRIRRSGDGLRGGRRCAGGQDCGGRGGGLRFSVAARCRCDDPRSRGWRAASRASKFRPTRCALPATSRCWAASGWRAGASRRADRRSTRPSTCGRRRTKGVPVVAQMAATCLFRFGHRVRRWQCGLSCPDRRPGRHRHVAPDRTLTVVGEASGAERARQQRRPRGHARRR